MITMFYKWFFVLSVAILPITLNPLTRHPIYVSVTEIEHNPKDKTLEISCKVFTDDFEKTLRKNYTGFIDLINPKDKDAMNKLVSGYVQNHLFIFVDGKKTSLQFIGYEQQEEGIVSFYQINNIASCKKIDVTDNILYEYKKEQISIVHITVGKNKKSTKLINPDEKVNFEF